MACSKNTDGIIIKYEFKDMTPGSADGVISFNFGNKKEDEIKTISLFWATGNEKDGFSPLGEYTEICSGDKSCFENGYTINKGLLIPFGVTALMAEISDGEAVSSVIYKLPAEKLTPERGAPLYTAAFASDFHLGGWGSDKEAKKGLKMACADMNKFADFLVASGDLVQWHASYSYAEFKTYNFDGQKYEDNGLRDPSFLRTGINQWQVAEDYFKGFEIPVYMLPGGHDIIDTDKWSPLNVSNKYYDDFFMNWVKYSENTDTGAKYQKTICRNEDLFYYDTELYGHHYIFLCIPNSESPYLSFGEKQLRWLDMKLYEKEESGKPIFIFGHTPICSDPGTVFYHYRSRENFGIGDGEAFKKILANHPTAIYVSGHLHSSLDTDELSSVDGAQVTPSHIHNSGMTTIVKPPVMSQQEGTHGVFAEVYDDCAILRGRDHIGGKWISRGLTKLTFKKACPIETLSVEKQKDADGNMKLYAKCSTTGISFKWSVDGTEHEAANITVEAGFNGFVALRAVDADGNYRSEIYGNIDKIPEAK